MVLRLLLSNLEPQTRNCRSWPADASGVGVSELVLWTLSAKMGLWHLLLMRLQLHLVMLTASSSVTLRPLNPGKCPPCGHINALLSRAARLRRCS
jgi:hypothetical protein